MRVLEVRDLIAGVVADANREFARVEQIKDFRLIDVLTLSATPIPRTLYLSLMGARDMSVIETPPDAAEEPIPAPLGAPGGRGGYRSVDAA